MKNKTLILFVVLVFVLAACSPASDTFATPNLSVDTESAVSQRASGSELQDDYNDALSIQSQLAVGTLLLEETDLAIDAVLAEELYPLWQAVQSLASSDTAAEIEVQAVVNQIQDTMTPEQIAAIAEMELTAEGLTRMLEEGTLEVFAGGFGRGSGDSEGEGETGRPGGGFGGGPGGGMPGAGRPAGGPGSGGFPEGLDPDAIATRQAEFASGDGGSFQERAMTGAVVRLLGTKTGDLSAEAPVRIFDVVFEVVAEATGLSVEDIRAQTGEGTTLADIVEANGGDLDVVYHALLAALNELPNADDLDPAALASQWLGLEE
jgi:hypothetical protein